MIAKFSPLTAVRWVRPERLISSTKAGRSSEVSPNTSPGINSPLSPLMESALFRKAIRIAPANLLMGSAALTCLSVDRVEIKAATLRSLV